MGDTLFFHCHLTPPDSGAKQLFQFLPPNLHLIDVISCLELMNDLCVGKCDLLHSNQSWLNDFIVKS